MEARIKEGSLEDDVPSLKPSDNLYHIKTELVCQEEDAAWGFIQEAAGDPARRSIKAEPPGLHSATEHVQDFDGSHSDSHNCKPSEGQPHEAWGSVIQEELPSVEQVNCLEGRDPIKLEPVSSSPENVAEDGPDQGFQCDMSLIQFELRMHTRHIKTHVQKEPFCCEVCSKQFSRRGNLDIHRKIHTGEKPFECTVCRKHFVSNSDLSRHGRTHTGERPFQCDMCNKRFTQSSCLSLHKLMHAGEKQFRCEVCDKRFTLPSGLATHRKRHTGEKRCGVCHKPFGSPSDLNRHVRTHTGEKPYRCEVCRKWFADPSALTLHHRTHTGERPFSCDVCHKRFSQSSALTTHKKIHTRE